VPTLTPGTRPGQCKRDSVGENSMRGSPKHVSILKLHPMPGNFKTPAAYPEVNFFFPRQKGRVSNNLEMRSIRIPASPKTTFEAFQPVIDSCHFPPRKE